MEQFSTDRKFFKGLSSALLGSILEFYDFTIYIFLSPIISKLFFPHDNPYISMMFVYGVFAIGYISRPLGAILFGHFGDRFGRQRMLVISMLILSLSTVLVGFLPTYTMIGIWAPLLLALLRIIQGLSAAGEMVAALTFAFELAPPKNRGFFSTIIWSGSGFGVIFASLIIAFLSSHLSMAQFSQWGWRIAFFFGIFTAFMSFYVKKLTSETVYFSAMVKRGEVLRNPLRKIIKSYKGQFFKIIVLFIPSAINFYTYYIFLPSHTSNLIGHVLPGVLLLNSIAMSILFVISPVVAFFSDRIGRKPFLIVSLVLNVVLSVFLFDLAATGIIKNLFLAQVIFSIIHAFYAASVISTALESVPTSVRYSLVGIAFNISYAVFGGTAPFVASYLIHHFKDLISPAYYIVIASAIVLFVVIKIRETYKEVIL